MIRPDGAKALGYLIETGPDAPGGLVRERDTFTCQHCGGVHSKSPGPSGQLRLSWCKKCMGLVCQVCRALPCDPIERKLERVERGQGFFCEGDPRSAP